MKHMWLPVNFGVNIVGEEVLPIYWYTEWGPGGQAIMGGHVYRGSDIPAFNGDYIWADWLPRANRYTRVNPTLCWRTAVKVNENGSREIPSGKVSFLSNNKATVDC